MGPIALDTGIVVGWLDADDAHHDAVIERLGGEHSTTMDRRIPAVALAELLTTRDKLRRARVHALVAGLGPDAIIPVDRTVAEIAGALRANNRSIRTPDALIAACAIAVGADTLLTTDRRLARLDGVEYVGSRRS